MAKGEKRIRWVGPAEAAWRLADSLRTLAERRGDPGAPAADRPAAPAPAAIPQPPIPAIENLAETVSLWRELFPLSVEHTLAEARGIIENRIPLFSRTVDYGAAIDWHLEPVSGRRAPLRFYRDIDTLDPAVVGDIKHIWELNRCNFLVTLGRAYAAGGGRRCYEAWRGFVSSWIEANPYNIGVNWESSLELAFRAVNWIWSGALFARELESDAALRERFLHTLRLHGRHIERHLSYYFSPNTHLTGEALGLLYLGTAFPALPRARQWRTAGARILRAQLDRQILPDGGYFEMSTWYHKYTIDFYLHWLLLCGNSDGAVRARVRALVRHLALLAAADGTIPLFGDSDGGRLLTLSPAKRSVRGACCTAATLLGDAELKSLCGGAFEEEALWLLGAQGLGRFRSLATEPPGSFHSLNRETGLFCFRTGMRADDPAIVIDCGPHGWRGCGHAHADLLSFVLLGAGGAVIEDPGTYTYSGSREIRDASRSSQSHNTITVNDVSQSVPGDTFRWRSIAAPRYSFCRAAAEFGYFEGEHNAYDTLAFRHKRVILYFGGRLIVIVDFLRAGRPLSSLLFNLQFGTGTLESAGLGMYRFARPGEEHFVRLMGAANAAVEIEAGRIFPDYHQALTAPRLRLRTSAVSGTRRIVTVLAPDRELVERFEDSGAGLLITYSGHTRYAIRAVVPAGDAGAFEADISSLVIENGRGLALLRNSAATPDVEGAERFEAQRRVPFLAARSVGDEVHLTGAQRPPRFRTGVAVRTVFVNGTAVPFESRDGWIRIAP